MRKLCVYAFDMANLRFPSLLFIEVIDVMLSVSRVFTYFNSGGILVKIERLSIDKSFFDLWR